ncbi:TonB-dependent receptor [Chitinophaga sp. 212800010-3]|uniref:SusC/RagA family TonB-linked outer membrane protein n=1 Tax=unclassified Chitinophaga TaxID=2619133 RepID=UPI002DE58A10|nr:TonB-linked outer membrane protein, SusC/RagA family [Chitinophaga sp. 212800010-3]
MKKRRFGGTSYAPGQTIKLFLIMKLCFVVVLLSCLHASAVVFSQEKFTLSFSRTDADKIFEKIQKESDYRFFYNYNTIRRLGKIDLHVKDALLAEIMNKILDSTISYRIVDHNLVVIAPRAEAADNTVSGHVEDSKGNPLVGVSVKVKGSSQGAVTDAKGNFSLQASSGAVLLITYMGYESKEVTVNGSAPLAIVLEESTSGLNEVVVIGYGTQRKKDVTGAISSISSKDLRNVPVRNAAEALQGKVSGVTVSQSSGSPGSPPVVRIRGIGSISGANAPLYIVDGLPQTDIGWLNPNDIESMDILKDASAAAIYGARGSNGVVIITTRKGSKTDQKMHVTFDSYTGIQSAWKRPHMLNASEFIEYKKRAYSAGNSPMPTSLDSDAKIAQVLKFVAENTGSPNGTDWWKEIMRDNAVVQSYNLGLTGAGKNLTYNTSAGYMKQEGIVKGSDYQRISWRTNVGADISPRVKFSSNIGLIYESRRNVDENNPYSGTIFSAMAADPITPVFRNNLKDIPSTLGTIMDGYDASNPYSQYAGILYSNKPNPVGQVERMQQSIWEGIAIKGGAALDVKILEPLAFRSNFGMDLARGISKGFTPSYYLNPFDYANLNTVSNTSDWNNYFVWENTLTFDKSFGRHHVTAMAGVAAELRKELNYGASKQGIVNNDPDMRIINAGTLNPGASGYTYSSALNSFLGRINYVYADRYILAANVRRDGSSSFGPGYRWGTFPSVSAAWRFSEENFLKDANLPWLTSGKLRASYGSIGNQNVGGGSGLYLSTYGNTFYRYLFGNTNNPYLGAERKTMANPTLQWETSTQADVALELQFFKGELDVSVDYFNKKVGNMLVQVPLPAAMGYPAGSPYWINAGKMVNKGWEVSIGHTHSFGDFSYNARLNVSTFKNKVLSMGGGEPIYTTAHLGEVISKTEEGMPVGYYFGWKTDGIFQTQDEVDKSPQKGISTPGDLRFKDINGTDANGKVVPGPDGKLDAADRTMIGNPWPDFVYGINIGLNYKRFDLTMFWQGSQGNDVMNILRYDTEAGTGWYNAPKGFLQKSWNGPGSTNKYYKISSVAGLNNSVSDYFVEDGSYLRLKNIQVGYNFPSNWLERAHIPQLRIYVGAQNLFTFTKYSGLDPEMGSENPRLVGIDQGYFPQARTFMIGLNARF